MLCLFPLLNGEGASANWNILITFSQVTNILSELGIGIRTCSKYYCITFD